MPQSNDSTPNESGLRPLVSKAKKIASSGAPAASMLVRLALGVMFAQSGWGKLQNLERTAGFFEGLGIPAPSFHAVLVGNVEFLGGILLVVGLLTRLVSIPLAVTMGVAILTAMLPDVEGPLDFITLDETLYLAILVLMITQGPGKWSLDTLVSNKLLSQRHPIQLKGNLI